MERIPEDKILEYNPDTLVSVRKLYNLDKPGQMDEAIDLLDAWIKKQDHFVRKEFSREYLERLIILLKGSVERAKSQIDRICTMRTLLPIFFEKYDVKNDLKDIHGIWYTALLPKLTKDNTRVYLMRFMPNSSYTAHHYLQMFIYIVIVSEYIKAHDYCDGFIPILDYRDVNIVEFATAINVNELRQLFSIYLEGYATRIKSIYIISASKTIDILVKIFKPLITKKVGDRICVLKSIEELHEKVPKELFPADYGGNEKPFDEMHDEFRDILSTPENIQYMKEMSAARTNESRRNTLTFNEEYLGMPGTFRTLNVD